MTVYCNGVFLTDGQRITGKELVVENGCIVGFAAPGTGGGKRVDLQGDFLAPGLMDLHCHGGNGFEFIDGTPESLQKACAVHFAHGTRVLYPTISATDYDTLYRALENFEAMREKTELILPGAHLEGPYLSPLMGGAQDTGVIHPPCPKEYEALVERFGSLIARWSFAPETDQGGVFARFLQKRGIVAATAHSAAEYEDMMLSLSYGNRLVTHLYSCTSTVVRRGGYRHLGVIETAFLEDKIFVEAIGDGCHLPAELMRMIVKIKGADKVCLISDAIRYAGMTACNGLVGTGNVAYLIEDGVAKLADRSAFAGSIATADVLLQRTVGAGIPVEQAVQMMTATPAKVMGQSDLGSLKPGCRALFTRLNSSLNAVSL